jgi:hypothetical protein
MIDLRWAYIGQSFVFIQIDPIQKYKRKIIHGGKKISSTGQATVYSSREPGFVTYFSGIHVVICYVFTCLVTYCDVRYDFREKRCSVRLYSYLFCRGFMFHLCYLYLFLKVYTTNTGVLHDFHIIVCSCRLAVTIRVSLVEQESFTYQSGRVHHRFCRVRVTQSCYPLSFFI